MTIDCNMMTLTLLNFPLYNNKSPGRGSGHQKVEDIFIELRNLCLVILSHSTETKQSHHLSTENDSRRLSWLDKVA